MVWRPFSFGEASGALETTAINGGPGAEAVVGRFQLPAPPMPAPAVDAAMGGLAVCPLLFGMPVKSMNA